MVSIRFIYNFQEFLYKESATFFFVFLASYPTFLSSMVFDLGNLYYLRRLNLLLTFGLFSSLRTLLLLLLIVAMECSQVYAVNSTEKKYIRHINNTNRQFDGHVEESRRVADSLKRTAMIFKNPEQYLYAHHILADAYLKARMYPEALKQTSILLRCTANKFKKKFGNCKLGLD
jgi:uncharacterized C2H2 Zn-finger protein